MINYIWRINDVRHRELRDHQDAVITNVFRITDIRAFAHDEDQPTWAYSWDLRISGWISDDVAKRLSNKVNMVGPLGAVMGRHMEVYLMEYPDARSVYVEFVNESIETSPSALNDCDYIAD